MDAPRPDTPPPQHSAPSRGLTEPLLRYLEARGVLLSIEAQEALAQIIRLLVYVGIASSSLFVAWLLLTGLAVDLIMTQAKWSWQAAVGAVGGFHLLLAIIFLLAVKNRLVSLHWFADTLNEFRKDRAWLASQTQKR